MDTQDLALLENPPRSADAAEPARESRAFFQATDREPVSQLTLGLVHEMNNLLGGIAVLSEIYQDSPGGDDGLAEGLGLIHQSTGRLQSLVAQLKALNDPPTGEPVYLNLSDAVRAWFEMFAPLLPKTLAVAMALPAEELAVHLDAALLRRVLLNLTLNLRNRLRRHPEVAGQLHVGIRTRPGHKAELAFSAGGGGGDATSADDRARLTDARQCLCKLGGTLIAGTNGEFILELPLVV